MEFLKDNRERIERGYQRLLLTFPWIGEEIDNVKLEGEELLALKYLYAVMPYSDVGNYPVTAYLDYVKHGVYLWKTYPRVRELPEEIYLNYCLQYRINSEEIRACRSLFHDKLKKRIEGLDIMDAVLEINYWCGEHVTYQSSDGRTLSALAVYERGNGRCGEESTFSVNVYRSVGIPARQVYTPLWSHCDDNHAWVEVWILGKWYFLGACEPEPVLNKGWFTNASSRAMLIHSRIFDTPRAGEDIISQKGSVTILNELKRYAKCTEISVRVYTENAEPIHGVKVLFEIINYAELAPIAEVITDRNGEIRFATGLGSLHILALQGDLCGEAYIDTRKTKSITLTLTARDKRTERISVDMTAPEESSIHANQIDKEVLDAHLTRLEEVNNLRNRRNASLKNADYEVFLAKKDDADIRKMLAEVISPKDKTDVKMEVLEDHLIFAKKYKEQYTEEIFTKYILNPRVENEVLTPYKEAILQYFNEEEQKNFIKDPDTIWSYIQNEITEIPDKENNALITAPAAALRLKKGNKRSKKVLFVAIARSLGIPAGYDTVYGDPQYKTDQEFHTVSAFSQEGYASLSLDNAGQNNLKYAKNFTIAWLDQEEYKTLLLDDTPWNGSTMELKVKAGYYRLVTSNRLPNGNTFAYVTHFHLNKGEHKELLLALRKAEIKDMQESIDLSDLDFIPVTDRKQLILFLDAGKEPTEHILNEMLEQSSAFKQYEEQITFYVKEEKDMHQETLKKTLNTFPNIQFKTQNFARLAETMGRRMYVDFESLPVIAVIDEKRNGIYAVSGYQVGTGEILLRLMEA